MRSLAEWPLVWVDRSGVDMVGRDQEALVGTEGSLEASQDREHMGEVESLLAVRDMTEAWLAEVGLSPVPRAKAASCISDRPRPDPLQGRPVVAKAPCRGQPPTAKAGCCAMPIGAASGTCRRGHPPLGKATGPLAARPQGAAPARRGCRSRATTLAHEQEQPSPTQG
ncbi:hypothetical protein B296_00028489 [Ensete ventricosum]|uniref:Uncharacterized protein n=1 Tax=Ensete ventricosum TaxID=4639 RepID=A0A426Y3P1_ENSVE|nr:hypothetical protein B296_00028489 [Ensete ventricosum]